MKDDCPFCSLTDRVIVENRTAVVILSNPRKVEGHFLVIPKRHITEPWDLLENEMLDIMRLITNVQRKITPTVSEGSDVLEHFRPFIPEGKIKVNHIHYHVLPRGFNDRIYKIVEKHETEDMYLPLKDSERSYFESLMKDEVSP